MSAVVRAYVGVGSNLGDPTANVKAGIAALDRVPESRLIACSSLYRSAPIGLQEQPDFANAVCALDTRLAAPVLLQALFAVEQTHGRVRGPVRGGPRTLDLDILLYGDSAFASADLTVPHARLHERAFVLCPLAEIAPTVRVPGREPLARLLSACAAQTVTRMSAGAAAGTAVR